MFIFRYALCVLLSVVTIESLASDKDSSGVKKISVYPVPAVGYSPETRWYFGGAVLLNMRLRDDSLLQTSTFETEINFTQNKQLILTANFDLQFFKSKVRWMGDNGYYKFPEDYWGIGNDTKESDKVNYDATRLELDNSILLKFNTIFYAGLRQRYHQMELKETVPNTDLPPAGAHIRASGIGPRFVIDSRNNSLNATKGTYLSINYQWFFPAIGGDNNFTKGEADLRWYKLIHRKGVLAFQAVLSVADGEVPFRLLPLLGGEDIMRGYYQGRYRSDGFGAIQGAYRLTVWKWVGAVVFGGAGKVTSTNQEKFVLHPSYGGGIRIRIDKKENVNLRFDYARGDYASGFYISFGEAF